MSKARTKPARTKLMFKLVCVDCLVTSTVHKIEVEEGRILCPECNKSFQGELEMITCVK